MLHIENMSDIHIVRNHLLTSRHDAKPFGVDWFFKPDGQAKPLVVFVHGFNAFKDWGHFNLIAEAFAQAGFFFVKFNLSHNGTSPEHPTEFVDLEAYGNDKFSTDLDDIGLVLDFILDPHFVHAAERNVSQLCLVGHSRGGALAILKAGEEERVKKLATWASIKSTRHFWTPQNIEEVSNNGVVYYYNGRTRQNLPLYYAYYEDVLLHPDRLDVEKAIKKLSIPVLLAHGDADESIPIAFMHRLQEWQPRAETLVVAGAGHTFGAYHPFPASELPPPARLLLDKTVAFLGASF